MVAWHQLTCGYDSYGEMLADIDGNLGVEAAAAMSESLLHHHQHVAWRLIRRLGARRHHQWRRRHLNGNDWLAA